MPTGTPADRDAIRQAMQQERVTVEDLAAKSDLSEKTIGRALEGSQLSDSTFNSLGKALDRSPKSLKKNRIEPFEVGSPIHAAFNVIVELLNDNAILLHPDKDFGTHIRSGQVSAVNGYDISINGWEVLLDHLIRRGHLYRKYDGTTRIAVPTLKQLLEVLDAREAFEKHLAENFLKASGIDQAAILASFDKSIRKAADKIDDPYRFIEAEAQVHLSWCYENHHLRDAFVCLLKQSKRLGDQLIAVTKADASRKKSPQPKDPHKDSFEQMVRELRAIRRTLSVGMSDITKTHDAIHVHVERVRKIAIDNDATMDRWRRAKNKDLVPEPNYHI